MQRHGATNSIAEVATGVVLLLAYQLASPIRLALRPYAAKRWDQRLHREIEARPQDRVKIFDRDGAFLGLGLREDVDLTHIAYAIPFGWKRKAPTVRDLSDHDIRGARFYFGKSGRLLERRTARAS